MTTKFGVRIIYRKAQVCAKFHCPNSAVTLFSKDGDGGIHSFSDKESQKSQANAGINFIHSHPPRIPGNLHQKFDPTFLHPSFCLGGGDLLGQLPRGGHLSINDVCHF